MFRPIGYWLKEVDRLIEESFAVLFRGDGLTRRHWQALNTIAGGPATAAGVDVALSPFEPTVAPVVDDLVARGWVARNSEVLTLTGAGRVAHESMSERVKHNRSALTEGITDAEYASVINILERMAGNLLAR